MRLSAPLCSSLALLVVAACSGDASSGLSDTSCRNDIDCPATHRCSASACVPRDSGAGGALFGGGAPSTGGSIVPSGGGPSGGGVGAGGSGQGGLFASGGSFAAGGGTGAGGASDAGAGGTPIDAAPPLDARPETGGTPIGKGVGCGTGTCALGERCCFTPAAIFSSPDYACSIDACADNETSVLCDGPEDCPDAQQCCRLSSGSGRIGFECRDTCPAAEIDCGGPQNCPVDTICCETTSSQGSVPERTDCATTCTGSEAWILCLVDADCPSNLPTCIPSDLLPGFRRCQ